MTDRRSIFFKYFLICTAVILISFICLGAVLLLISSRYFNNEKEIALKKNMENLSAGIARTMKNTPDEWTKGIQISINEYAKNSESKILLFNSSGEIILVPAAIPAAVSIPSSTQTRLIQWVRRVPGISPPLRQIGTPKRPPQSTQRIFPSCRMKCILKRCFLKNALFMPGILTIPRSNAWQKTLPGITAGILIRFTAI